MLNDLLMRIRSLEARHKTATDLTLTADLLAARNTLRDLLLAKQEWLLKKLKIKSLCFEQLNWRLFSQETET